MKEFDKHNVMGKTKSMLWKAHVYGILAKVQPNPTFYLSLFFCSEKFYVFLAIDNNGKNKKTENFTQDI